MKTICTMAIAAGLGLAQEKVISINAVAGGPQPTIAFFGNSEFDVEKGAAYSADTITETTQVLSDGNRIKNSNKSSFARDNEGRTRMESTIQMLGPVGKTEEPIVTVFISDPVAKLQYTLDSHSKTAMKSSMVSAKIRKSARATSENVVIERKATKMPAEAVFVEERIVSTRTHPAAMQWTTRVDSALPGQEKQEDLGSRMIEGVSAKGLKVTRTIPAGEVGNERPIEVVTETWFSEEIKGVVLSKHNDPRMGETVTRLTNIRLGEPSKSLFEPPVDYKIEVVKNMRTILDTTPVMRVKEDR
jgi:hypothetical protein